MRRHPKFTPRPPRVRSSAVQLARADICGRITVLNLLLVEDNTNLRSALKTGLESTGQTAVAFACASGEEALAFCLAAGAREAVPDVALMDVQLAGELNGVAAAVALRREFPRFPVVFYSIQDDD